MKRTNTTLKNVLRLVAICLAFAGSIVCGETPKETSSLTAGDPPKLKAFFRRLSAGEKQTVVVYGTSLTEGGAWTSAMRKWFDKHFPKQVTFVNSGGSGQNSTWGKEALRSKVLAHRPDVVLIEFSYNDAHEKFRLSPQQASGNLQKIIEEIHGELQNAAIVLQIMNIPWDAPNGNRSASVRAQLEHYNEVYRRASSEYGLPLIDHSVTWRKLKEENPEQFFAYIPDGSHPSREGSLAVTWPVIKGFFETFKPERVYSSDKVVGGRVPLPGGAE